MFLDKYGEDAEIKRGIVRGNIKKIREMVCNGEMVLELSDSGD